MNPVLKHITTSLLAGLVAILPIGGLIMMIGALESSISKSGVSQLSFYFPGLGIIIVVLLIYLIGLILTTFVGKWIWGKIDNILNNLPALGKLYVSLKQILGYGEGKDAIFHETVLVPAQGGTGMEFGLITNKINLPDGSEKLVVFIPGSPNPTTGRLIITQADQVQITDIPVNTTFKLLVAAGKADIKLN